MLAIASLDSEVEMKTWDAFVESHPSGSPYHLSPWLRALRETYGFKPLLYAAKSDGGELQGVFPLFLIKGLLGGSRIVSLPFSDYGGPLFIDETAEKECVKEILDVYANACKYIEIRGKVPEDERFVSHNYYKRHILDLDADSSVVRKKIDKRTIQYSIRKAEKSGITIEEANSESGMDKFFRLNALTRKKHGVPGQPRKFFNALYREVIAKDNGFLYLATHKSKVVAGSLFLKCGKVLHYKYNASDPDMLSQLTPNHSLTWEAVVKGCKGGYTSIDFGRTSPDNEGLMRYKGMWGANCLDVMYYYYPQIRGATSIEESGLAYKTATWMWQKLPDYLVERLGPFLYRLMS